MLDGFRRQKLSALRVGVSTQIRKVLERVPAWSWAAIFTASVEL